MSLFYLKDFINQWLRILVKGLKDKIFYWKSFKNVFKNYKINAFVLIALKKIFLCYFFNECVEILVNIYFFKNINFGFIINTLCWLGSWKGNQCGNMGLKYE